MKISSYDDSQHRHQRLDKVRRVAAHLLNLSEKQLDQLVDEIHDHKGNLEVTWLIELPNEFQRHAFGMAWEMSGECRKNVYHGMSREDF